MTGIRVLVVEDERHVRDALSDLIESEADLTVVGAAADTDEAIELAGASRPDVALVDVRMPGGGGPRAAREIIKTSPATRVLALSAFEDRSTVLDMLRAGAVGYLVKGTSPAEIVRAIQRAARGQSSLSAEVMASVVEELSTQLKKEEAESTERAETIERIRRVIGGDGLTLVYQQVLDLRDRSVVGMEALSRFTIPPPRGPQVWFQEAARVDLAIDLELTAVAAALDDLPRLPVDAHLSINLSHRAAMSSRLHEVMQRASTDRVVAEITEHEQVEDYDTLYTALNRLRTDGLRLAIDDTGAGFASLRHILRLSPDFIKLDISLTRDIDTDRGRRALASALISFAEEMGITIIAEGIETQAELDALRELGVVFGQGFFLAKPAPLP